MSVCVFVCLFPNSFKTAKPIKLKWWINSAGNKIAGNKIAYEDGDG